MSAEPTRPTIRQGDLQCVVDGCVRTDADTAILRTSPKGKGKPFEGMCPEHYAEWTDPATWAAENPE